ncbi:MAG: ribonuclease III [Ignavibacteria bacterium]|nr:ribonuclease III [Ignavibacteria bacterium]
MKVEKLVGTKIYNPTIYLEALTHRSGVNISPLEKKQSNERLEFLGDSVLNLVVTEYIFSKFKEEDEGQMTILRSRFVNKEILLSVANKIEMSKLLFVNDNAASAIEAGAKSILADSIEALIGAIYLDAGLERAKKFIMKYIILPNLKLMKLKDQNYKSQLLEFVQAKKLATPRYEVVKEEGPQHAKIFTVQVSIDGIPLGIGSGQTKKSAEQIAAKQAIEKLKNPQ